MKDNFFRCNENSLVIKKNNEVTIESPPLINSKAILYKGSEVVGMLHVSDQNGLNKITDFLTEIKKNEESFQPQNIFIAMKTYGIDFDDDKELKTISKKIDLPIDELQNNIISMDAKSILTISGKETETIQFY